MIKFQKLTWRGFFESPLFFVAGLVILILVSISFARAQFKDREIRSEIAQLEDQVLKLEGERNRYEDILALLNTPQFIEDEARRSLGYVFPGEKVVVIEQQDKRDTQDKQDKQEMSNPRKWWIYFFGDI